MSASSSALRRSAIGWTITSSGRSPSAVRIAVATARRSVSSSALNGMSAAMAGSSHCDAADRARQQRCDDRQRRLIEGPRLGAGDESSDKVHARLTTAKSRTAASTSSGRSLISMWPAPSSITTRALGSAAASACPALAASSGRAAQHQRRRHRHLGGGRERRRGSRCRRRDRQEYAGRARARAGAPRRRASTAPAQRAAEAGADSRGPRSTTMSIAAWSLALAASSRSGRNRHRPGGRRSAPIAADLVRVPRRRFPAPPASPWNGRRAAPCAHRPAVDAAPRSSRPSRRSRARARRRAAVPRQIGREHATAVMREPARQQRPDRMIEAGAVQEDDGRQRRIEIAAAGGDEGVAAVNGELHGSCPLRGAQRLREIVDDVARRLDARPRGAPVPRRRRRP